jgi:DNA-binding GntR family transcriptional regulator
MEDKVGQSRGFAGVYNALRETVLAGRVAPGAQIRVNEAAASLGLSATPVREALSRLVGEGLLEDRPRLGFFVPLPTAYDLVDLLGLAELHLTAALGATGQATKPIEHWRENDEAYEATTGGDAAARIFVRVLARSNNFALIDAGRRVVDRLAPLRRAESMLFIDSAEELRGLDDQLHQQSFPQLRSGLKAYHRRRRSHAGELAYLISKLGSLNNIPDIV